MICQSHIKRHHSTFRLEKYPTETLKIKKIEEVIQVKVAGAKSLIATNVCLFCVCMYIKLIPCLACGLLVSAKVLTRLLYKQWVSKSGKPSLEIQACIALLVS